MSVIRFLMAGMRSAPFAFVMANTNTSSGASVSISYAGAAAGNLCVIVRIATDTTLSATGYSANQSYTASTSGGVNDINVIYKVLTAGDIAAGSVTVSTGGGFQGFMAFFYAGCTVATLVSSADAVSSVVTIPGFTKNAASKGIITVATDRSSGGLVKPTAFTSRIASTSWTAGTMAAADLVSSSYTNGTGEQWGGGGGTNTYAGSMIELK